MKNYSLKTALILAVIALIGISLRANGEEFKKSYEKRFDVDKNATLQITNKFGDVHCQVWNENAVSVKVEIVVEASSQEKAQKVFDKITVDITGDRGKVTGTTTVGNMSFNNTEFSIDYYIMMPRSLNINLDQRFGELFVEDVDGSALINLEYGEMNIRALNGLKNEITMKFSEGSINYLKDAKIDIEYGELDITGANNLDLRSRFSELTVEKSESVLLDSQYDEIDLGTTGKLDVTGRFSDVSVDKLNGNFVIDTQYGSIEMDYIFSGFSKGAIDASFSDISLEFDPAASFQVDARMEFCSLNYPSSNASVSHQEENYVNNLYHGVIGSNKSATATLSIKSRNGDVTVSY